MKQSKIKEIMSQITYVDTTYGSENATFKTPHATVELEFKEIKKIDPFSAGVFILLKWGLITIFEDGYVDVRTFNSTRNRGGING